MKKLFLSTLLSMSFVFGLSAQGIYITNHTPFDLNLTLDVLHARDKRYETVRPGKQVHYDSSRDLSYLYVQAFNPHTHERLLASKFGHIDCPWGSKYRNVDVNYDSNNNKLKLYVSDKYKE